MRIAPLLLLLVAAPLSAQQAAPLCGAPDVLSVDDASRRLSALAPPSTEPARDTYESTAEWEERLERVRADQRRTALQAFGSRTLRVGGVVSVRYDADAEALVLGETAPAIRLPDIPYSLPRTKMYQGETSIVIRAASGLWGDSQIEPPLSLSDRHPSVRLSRAVARTLDAATNPTCFFVIYRIFGADAPVVGYDRIEIVSVVRGQPHVWSWTLGDDGTEGSPDNRPPSPPEPPPAPPPTNDPLDFSEVSPVLIGGIERLQQSIRYPDFECRARIEGRVIVRYVVGADGRASNVEVVRSVSPGLDRAAIQAVQRARFEPGKQNGQAVQVRQTLPITFRVSGACEPPPAAPR